MSLCGNTGNETELDMSGTMCLSLHLNGGFEMSGQEAPPSMMRGAGDAIMLVPEIVDNGALEHFAFSGNGYESTPAIVERSMTEADYRGKDLGASGVIMLAGFLPKCQ
jgi:hypothetical protein